MRPAGMVDHRTGQGGLSLRGKAAGVEDHDHLSATPTTWPTWAPGVSMGSPPSRPTSAGAASSDATPCWRPSEATGCPTTTARPGDVLSGVESLLAVGLADPQRLFLFGRSYGAYLLNRILTVDHRFRAVVEHAGMVWRWYSAQARVADGAEDRRWRVLAGHRRCVAAARCGFRHRGSRREYLGAGWRTGSNKEAQVRCTCSKFRLLLTAG